jgi:predicted amidohydrolase
MHCRTFEDMRFHGGFTPEESFRVVQLSIAGSTFNLGTMICFDREIPETVRCLRALGAELIACPLACDTFSLAKHFDFAENEGLTRVRAAENEVFIAVVNHAQRFNGGSFLVGPGGEALGQLGSAPAVEIFELPLQDLREKIHRDPYGWMGWGYRRPEVYQRTPGFIIEPGNGE